MTPCLKIKFGDGTCGFLTIGNKPIVITVRGKIYRFELLNSGGAEPVNKNGCQSSQVPPKNAWIALQCKTAKLVYFETSNPICNSERVTYKAIYADNLLMAYKIGKTEEQCDEGLSDLLSVLQENGIRVL